MNLRIITKSLISEDSNIIVGVSDGAQIWADTPWPLIPTTEKASKHAAIYIAKEMTYTHNCMLQGLNSIYHQAENVRQYEEIADFLFFVKCWTGWVSRHHIMEEEMMSPGFEKLKTLQDYSAQTQPLNFDASIIRNFIEEMGPTFRDHLGDEIDSLLRMIHYNSKALKVYKSCVAEVAKQDKFPMVLGLRDVTFESGNQRPSLPPMADWIINYLLARKHAGAWRFLPCDGWGKPRSLVFGLKPEGKEKENTDNKKE
ncbi:hypothetical protein N7447_009473 [Penicillium robsamsonii]|uniref:uncharacterized protein n=1 Tax=Penicillium robsamsonii TaxID=1792511 RepID=UPI00254673DC|nr:uncharacterized protein N7447_009473 [Penicillium robsamsonii]KAJ5817240.1 hypothetical protein N7447_009473 [Penicillium robsamsonii]